MTTKPLNVALIPLNIEWENKEKNLDNLAAKLAKLPEDTDLVVLPETFSTGFPSGEEKEHVRGMAERNTGATIDYLKKLAAHYNIAIAGSFIADTGGSLYNRAFFIEPSGEEYFSDKRHLFTMAGENKVFSKGHDRLCVRYRGWNIAMIICYDIRFPAWCRNVNNEYDLLLAVANWPDVRIDAWEKLLYARAIENEAYVCGVNCGGTDLKGFSYNGKAMAIDFKGKDCAETLSDNVVTTTLNKEKLDRFREKFPAWKDSDKFEIKIDD